METEAKKKMAINQQAKCKWKQTTPKSELSQNSSKLEMETEKKQKKNGLKPASTI